MSKVVKTVGIVALGVAAAVTGVGLAGGLALSQVAGLGVSFFGLSTGLSVAQFGLLGGLAVVVGSKPNLADIAEQAGAKTPIANSTDTRKIVYGQARIGGTEIFIEEYDSNGGNDVPNDTLALARVVADHPINRFVQFYLGDKAVTIDSDWDQTTANTGNASAAPYRDNLFIRVHDGTQTFANGRLKQASTSWTDDHIGLGLSYFTVKAGFKPDVFPFGVGDIRNCSMVIEGKKVYDPRKDSTYPGGAGTHRISDPDTWEYSANPALCIYDFLRDNMLGREWPNEEIDVASVVTAANVCDEQVPVVGGGTIDRYTLNGVVDSKNPKLKNLDRMLTAMGGSRTYVAGKVAIFAAAPVVSTLSIERDHIQGIRFEGLPDKLVNEVRGTYIDPADNYEAAEYPAAIDAGAQLEEGEESTTLDLPYTNDHRIAQRLATIHLRMERQARIAVQTMPVGAALAPNHVCSISWANLDLSFEPFRLLKQTVTGGDGKPMSAALELIKEDPSIYAWTAATDEKERAAGLVLKQPTGLETFTPANVVVTPAKIKSTDGSETAVLNVTWDDPGVTIANTIVEYRVNGNVTWIPGEIALRGDNNVTLILPHNKSWDIRIRHVMLSGVVSPEVIVSNTSTEVTVPQVLNQDTAIDDFMNHEDEWWTVTSGFRFESVFFNGRIRNCQTHYPIGHANNPDGDEYEYLEGKPDANELWAGARSYNEPFDAEEGEEIYVEFYGPKPPAGTTGFMWVGIQFRDADNDLIADSIYDNAIEPDSILSHDKTLKFLGRTFTTPRGATSGVAFYIIAGHTAGLWRITGCKHERLSYPRHRSVLSLGLAPEARSTRGAPTGTPLATSTAEEVQQAAETGRDLTTNNPLVTLDPSSFGGLSLPDLDPFADDKLGTIAENADVTDYGDSRIDNTQQSINDVSDAGAVAALNELTRNFLEIDSATKVHRGQNDGMSIITGSENVPFFQVVTSVTATNKTIPGPHVAFAGNFERNPLHANPIEVEVRAGYSAQAVIDNTPNVVTIWQRTISADEGEITISGQDTRSFSGTVYFGLVIRPVGGIAGYDFPVFRTLTTQILS